MDYIADLHTHTLASTHAYSTVLENAAAAKEKGIGYLAVTDHGPMMEDSPHPWHFGNLGALPGLIYGVRILRGIEANILPEGRLDLEERLLAGLDWVVASMHSPLYPEDQIENTTENYCRVVQNPFVDVIGHSASQHFPYDYDVVLPEVKKHGKIMEIKGRFSSERVREAYLQLALACLRHEVRVTVNSDAHFAGDIGAVQDGLSVLEEAAYPKELILCGSRQNMEQYLEERKERIRKWKRS